MFACLVFTSPGSGDEHNFPFERQRHPFAKLCSPCGDAASRVATGPVLTWFDSGEVKLLPKFPFRIAKGVGPALANGRAVLENTSRLILQQ